MALAGKKGICSNCLTETQYEVYFKPWGWVLITPSIIVTLFVWVLAIITVPVILVAALAGNGKRCPKCRTENGVLEIDSPAAKLLLKQMEVAGVEQAKPRELVRNKFGGVEVKQASKKLVDGEWVDS